MASAVVHTDELLLIRWLVHDLIENDLRVPLIVDLNLFSLMLFDEVIG